MLLVLKDRPLPSGNCAAGAGAGQDLRSRKSQVVSVPLPLVSRRGFWLRYRYLWTLTAPARCPAWENPNGFHLAGGHCVGTWTFSGAFPQPHGGPLSGCCPECFARAQVWSRSLIFFQGAASRVHSSPRPLPSPSSLRFTCCANPSSDFPAIQSLETSHPDKLPLA
ncbi:hypothetical protein VTI74DRAFT_3881 [Chaetomium olivicolor]